MVPGKLLPAVFVDSEDGAKRSEQLERSHQDRRAARQTHVLEDRVGVVQDARLSSDLLVPFNPKTVRKSFGHRSQTVQKPFGNSVQKPFGNRSPFENRSDTVRT